MIYLDHAATTSMHPDVVEAMKPFYSENFANASGAYEIADKPKKQIEMVRKIIASSIGAKSEEIYFTSGGTEADNWALLGIAQMCGRSGHIITSAIEHHAVLNTCAHLEKLGYDVTYLGVDSDGIISPDELEKAIRDDTVLISIMAANNEIGTLQPLEKIGDIARKHGIYFHTDAVQAYLHMPIDVKELKIDCLSASAHKFQGPKGVGFLYVRQGISIEPFMFGGKQERGKRAGTENVAGIVGMGKAVEIGMFDLERQIYLRNLRDYLYFRLKEEIPFISLNGSKRYRLSGNLNLSFKYIEGESLLILLDMEGICASSGSACTTGQKEPSHVLKAIGLSDKMAKGSLRMTLGMENTIEEMDFVVEKISEIVGKLRESSDEYQSFIKNRVRFS